MITASDLAHQTCSDGYYYHPLFRAVNYTSGVKYLSDNGCSWLVTDILSHLIANPDVVGAIKNDPFLVINFKRDAQGWVIEIATDEGDVLATEHRITNAIDTEVKFYYIDGVMLLASEY